jgi:hypothetical protein
MRSVTSLRIVWTLAVALACTADALAQTAPAAASPPSFAVLSLVGDQFDVVMKREEIGSHIDPNSHRNVPFDSAALDDIALGAAENVLKRLKPVSPVVRFSIRDARLFALQDKLLVDSPESRDMREALAKLLREHQTTRLVLVTKWRDDAQFKMYSGTTGTGKLSGLGFYVDPYQRLRMMGSGEETNGFLAAFAYLKVSTVDVASMAVVRSVQARESQMSPPLHATGAVRAWDALTPEGKVEALDRVLRRAVESATTAALAD